MRFSKRRTLSTAVIAAGLGLGIAGASWAASNDSPGDVMADFSKIMKDMMRDTHFGRHRGAHRKPPLAARPLVSIALRNHEKLQLTDSQVKRLKDIRDAFSKKAVKQRAEMKAGRIDLRRALDVEKIDFADVEKRMRGIADMRVSLRLARLRAIQEGKAVLSDAQQKQLVKIARERRGHGFHRQMFRGRGQGDGGNRPQTY